MRYQATLNSLGAHPVPNWFEGAKLGIFIHWGLYSVPAWADTSMGSIADVMDRVGPRDFFVHSPYAEWYGNTMKLPGSPTYNYHIETFGSDFDYADFVPRFNEESAHWEPDQWAKLFQHVGARYVVLTTKHHDGFLLWPSSFPNPFRSNFVARRDIVGELAEAVRRRGMRMGLYYSSGLDWTFNPAPLRDIVNLITTMPQSESYSRYVRAHWRELMRRYRPDVLWNDIGYPARLDLLALFASYYNWISDGVINDRIMQAPAIVTQTARLPMMRWLLNVLAGVLYTRHAEIPARGHFDFSTPEYSSFSTIRERKWEATRGIGHSFGYNRREDESDHLSTQELIHSFVDIVSKNGNLLLNVGPRANGSIPELQLDRLVGLGRWLEINGDAIFDTRPWDRPEGWCHLSTTSVPVRFTQKPDTLYFIILGEPQPGDLRLGRLRAREGTEIQLLGHPGTLPWRQENDGITVGWSTTFAPAAAYCLKLVPMPSWIAK